MSNSMTIADVFYVLDFDRCLGNTQRLSEALEDIIESETAISRAQLQRARYEAEARGDAFDTSRYVRARLADLDDTHSWQSLLQQFIKTAQTQNMLEPYAHALLAILDAKRIPYGILTFGSEAWQLAKLEASNMIEVPHLVTHLETKGILLSGWRKGENEFIIPPALTRDFQPLIVKSIVFLDDKVMSFYDMPPEVQGVHITGVGTPLKSQGGDLPAGVVSVQGLYGAIEYLFPKELDTIIDKT